MTEEPTAGVGHNGAATELTDEQRRALFFYHLGRVKNKKAEAESVNGELRNTYKVAKADGYTKKEIDFAIRLEKADEHELMEERRRQHEIATWMQHPVGVQLSLLDEPNRTPASERAEEEGFAAGSAGESCEPPFDSHEPRQAWISGWHRGQKAILSVWESRQTPIEEAAADGDEERPDPDAENFDDGPAPDFVTKTHAERTAANDTGDDDHADAAE